MDTVQREEGGRKRTTHQNELNDFMYVQKNSDKWIKIKESKSCDRILMKRTSGASFVVPTYAQ